jgi:pimeloyl-ACP methyl ester carboxylesterase
VWLHHHKQMDRPETRFAWNGDVSLAYQVCGDGPTDLVYLQGYCSNVDMNWESPYLSRFLRGLAGCSRLIVTDRRGWGCSERFTPGHIPDVDSLTDDILAVLKAARSERASILGTYESAIVASLFAATYPERTRSLILVDPQVTYLPTEDTPWMPSLDRWQEQIQAIRDTWGTSEWWDAPDGAEREWFVRYARACVTPGGLAAELTSYVHTDIRAVLPTIQVPTLVLVDSDRFYEVLPETGHFVASKIPGARVVEHSSRGGPTSTGMRDVTRSSASFVVSWPRSARRRRRSIGSSPRSSSPTSSTRRSARPSLGIAAGVRWLCGTTRRYERSSRATEGSRSPEREPRRRSPGHSGRRVPARRTRQRSRHRPCRKQAEAGGSESIMVPA